MFLLNMGRKIVVTKKEDWHQNIVNNIKILNNLNNIMNKDKNKNKEKDRNLNRNLKIIHILSERWVIKI